LLIGNAGSATLSILNSGLVGNVNGNIGVLAGASGDRRRDEDGHQARL